MSIDATITSPLARQLSLLLLRVTTGFLLIWSGLAKVVGGQVPFALARFFTIDPSWGPLLSLLAGGAQVLIGALCVVGLFRRAALPVQAVIHGFTAASVWWAIVDPYRWYISGVDRIVFNSHVFYPTSITFAACIVLIACRPLDRFALDVAIARRRATVAPGA